MAIELLADILAIFKVLGCVASIAVAILFGIFAGNTVSGFVVRWRKVDSSDHEKLKLIIIPCRVTGGMLAGGISFLVGFLQIMWMEVEEQHGPSVDIALALFAKAALEASIVVWILAGLVAAAFYLVQIGVTRASSSRDIPLQNWRETQDKDGNQALLRDSEAPNKSSP